MIYGVFYVAGFGIRWVRLQIGTRTSAERTGMFGTQGMYDVPAQEEPVSMYQGM